MLCTIHIPALDYSDGIDFEVVPRKHDRMRFKGSVYPKLEGKTFRVSNVIHTVDSSVKDYGEIIDLVTRVIELEELDETYS